MYLHCTASKRYLVAEVWARHSRFAVGVNLSLHSPDHQRVCQILRITLAVCVQRSPIQWHPLDGFPQRAHEIWRDMHGVCIKIAVYPSLEGSHRDVSRIAGMVFIGCAQGSSTNSHPLHCISLERVKDRENGVDGTCSPDCFSISGHLHDAFELRE